MIILTGASGGIGKSLINDLGRVDNVIGIYHQNIVEAEVGSRISYQQVDLNDEGKIGAFIDKNREVLQNITVVHGAGITEDQLVVNLEKDAWNRVVEVNLTANYLLTKALIPIMMKDGWGRIVHLSSIRAAPGTLPYSTTKAGLIGMSSVLAKEYAKFNVTSNALVLGAFDTGMFHHLRAKVQSEMISQIPSKKLGDVRNIVHAIDFLIKSPFVNGASIVIDGAASV